MGISWVSDGIVPQWNDTPAQYHINCHCSTIPRLPFSASDMQQSAFSIFARIQRCLVSESFSPCLCAVPITAGTKEFFGEYQCFLWYQAMQNTIDKRGKVSAGSLGEETILFSLQKKTKTPAGHHRCLSIGSLGGAEKPTTFPNYHTSIRKKVSDFSGEKHHFFVFYITFFCVRKYAIIVEKKEDTL